MYRIQTRIVESSFIRGFNSTRQTKLTIMFKTAIAAAAAAIAFAPAAALAGPYVNIESNSGFLGNDYSATLLETHVGFEGPVGEDASWYIQGGPAVEFADGVKDNTTELSGKVGLTANLTEKTSVYGEVWAATNGEIDFDVAADVNVKAGVKYSF